MELRPLEKKDAEGILEWMKDPEINCFFRFIPDSITISSVMDFIDNSMSNEARNYAVVNEKDNYLGTISLKKIDIKDKNAEFAISFRKTAIGTGVALFATKTLLGIAFNELMLNKVYLSVLSDNERAIKFYKKVGFEYEGEFKEHIIINGHFRDIKFFAIRRSQYEMFK